MIMLRSHLVRRNCWLEFGEQCAEAVLVYETQQNRLMKQFVTNCSSSEIYELILRPWKRAAPARNSHLRRRNSSCCDYLRLRPMRSFRGKNFSPRRGDTKAIRRLEPSIRISC